MNILITGGRGQLGCDILEHCKEKKTTAYPFESSKLDYSDYSAVYNIINELKPDTLIHCSAYTDVDGAEINRDQCYKINVTNTENLARVCGELDVTLIYISTDYVFDGSGSRPWETCDRPDPVNYYGETKYMGEQKVLEYCAKYYIVRVSWLYGLRGKNFPYTMLRLFKEKKKDDTITVINDQIGSPTYTKDLARLLINMAAEDKYGIYHATNEGFCSWYNLANHILQSTDSEARIKPVKSENYKQTAKRPLNSRLDKSSLTENGFHRLRSWQDAIDEFLSEAKKGGI